jgi:hypothetical protein
MGMITGVAPRSDVQCRVILIETWAGGLLQDRVLGLADDRAESTGYWKRTFTFDSYVYMYMYMYRYYIFKLLCIEKAAVPCTVPRAFSQEQITDAAYVTVLFTALPAT